MGYDTSIQKKLKEIPTVDSFEALVNALAISETDKEVLRLHYLEQKDFQFIADKLGYSESWVRKRHYRALNKVRKLLT